MGGIHLPLADETPVGKCGEVVEGGTCSEARADFPTRALRSILALIPSAELHPESCWVSVSWRPHGTACLLTPTPPRVSLHPIPVAMGSSPREIASWGREKACFSRKQSLPPLFLAQDPAREEGNGPTAFRVPSLIRLHHTPTLS